MAPVMWFGLIGKPTEMTIALFAGFACSVLLNLDKFESFKAGQIEAKLREADKAIKEANATIGQLRRMTEPLMNYLLAHIIRGNRIAGVSGYDKEELFKRLSENSKQFSIDSEYNKELLAEAKYNVIETFLYEIEFEVEGKVGYERAEPIREFINKNYVPNSKKFPSVAKVRLSFDEHPNLYNNKVEDSIKEYERVLNELID